MRRKRRNHILAAVLAGCILISAVPVMAKEQENTVQKCRKMQQEILQWKLEQTEQKTLVSGEVLKYAGQSASDWFVFAAARSGILEGQGRYLKALQKHVETIYDDLEENLSKMYATDWHRLSLTILACGGDPTAFGTDSQGNPINLVADGTWNCLTGDPGAQGINGYVWALYVMDSRHYTVPEDARWTREVILEKILEQQQENGGFALSKEGDSDADITALVLTALAPYSDDPKICEAAEKGFAVLSQLQQSDGTVLSYGERTSESTAWTLVALSAWNRDAGTDTQFVKNGHTLYDGLMSFCLADGSVVHSLDGMEPETEGNNLSSYQVFYALEAGCRQLQGENPLFDLSDVTAEAKEETEGMTRTVKVLLCAVLLVTVVVCFLLVLLKESRKEKEKWMIQE